MDWLVESETDESDDQSVVSTKGSKRKTIYVMDVMLKDGIEVSYS